MKQSEIDEYIQHLTSIDAFFERNATSQEYYDILRLITDMNAIAINIKIRAIAEQNLTPHPDQP